MINCIINFNKKFRIQSSELRINGEVASIFNPVGLLYFYHILPPFCLLHLLQNSV